MSLRSRLLAALKSSAHPADRPAPNRQAARDTQTSAATPRLVAGTPGASPPPWVEAPGIHTAMEVLSVGDTSLPDLLTMAADGISKWRYGRAPTGPHEPWARLVAQLELAAAIIADPDPETEMRKP